MQRRSVAVGEKLLKFHKLYIMPLHVMFDNRYDIYSSQHMCLGCRVRFSAGVSDRLFHKHICTFVCEYFMAFPGTEEILLGSFYTMEVLSLFILILKRRIIAVKLYTICLKCVLKCFYHKLKLQCPMFSSGSLPVDDDDESNKLKKLNANEKIDVKKHQDRSCIVH